jgi:uroporphyrinogen-III synthase
MKRLLYLGLRPQTRDGYELVHYPVIRVEPCVCRELEEIWPRVTHLVISSPTVAELLMLPVENRFTVAIGEGTRAACAERSIPIAATAKTETSEGVVELLGGLEWPLNSLCAVPRSSRSRDLIRPALTAMGVACRAPVLYQTHLQQPGPPPSLDQFDAIAFTSPSTVDGFLAIYGALPEDKEIITQGPVTLDTIQLLR